MAVLTSPNCRDRYRDENARENLIKYVTNPHKAKSGFYGGVMVDIDHAAEEMRSTATEFKKDSGVRLRHFILSFDYDEVRDPKMAYDIAHHLALVMANRYETVYAVHQNTDQLHIHFILNSVSYTDGMRYSGSRKEFYALMSAMKHVLQDYNIYNFYYMSS